MPLSRESEQKRPDDVTAVVGAARVVGDTGGGSSLLPRSSNARVLLFDDGIRSVATTANKRAREDLADVDTEKKFKKWGSFQPLSNPAKEELNNDDHVKKYKACKEGKPALRNKRKAGNTMTPEQNPGGANGSGRRSGPTGMPAKPARASLKLSTHTWTVPLKKRCPHCKEEKAASEFYRRRNAPGGLDHRCKKCDKLYPCRNKQRAIVPIIPAATHTTPVTPTAPDSDESEENISGTKGTKICSTRLSLVDFPEDAAINAHGLSKTSINCKIVDDLDAGILGAAHSSDHDTPLLVPTPLGNAHVAGCGGGVSAAVDHIPACLERKPVKRHQSGGSDTVASPQGGALPPFPQPKVEPVTSLGSGAPGFGNEAPHVVDVARRTRGPTPLCESLKRAIADDEQQLQGARSSVDRSRDAGEDDIAILGLTTLPSAQDTGSGGGSSAADGDKSASNKNTVVERRVEVLKLVLTPRHSLRQQTATLKNVGPEDCAKLLEEGQHALPAASRDLVEQRYHDIIANVK